MKIWDIHCHADWPTVAGETLAQKVEYVIQIAERMGIERLGLFLRPNNNDREISDVLNRYRQQVFGFLWMTLWNETVESSIGKLNRWIRDGPMVGMKLAGPDGVCSLPVYDPVFQRAAELKAGIFIHAWLKVGGDPPLPGGREVPNESKPQDVAKLAARRPDVPVICGHGGGDWELGVRAVRATKNVFLEISGSYPTSGMLEMAVRELGAERIIFGSDIPGRSFASQLAKVHGAAISDQEKQLVFSGNLQRILGPILKTKGMTSDD